MYLVAVTGRLRVSDSAMSVNSGQSLTQIVRVSKLMGFLNILWMKRGHLVNGTD